MTEDPRGVVPEDEPTADDAAAGAPPAVEPRPDKKFDRPSQRRTASDAPSVRRVRTRMSLRVPDEDPPHPTPVAMPVAEPYEPPPPPPDVPLPEIKGTRIISVGPPSPEDALPPIDPLPSFEMAPAPPVPSDYPIDPFEPFDHEDSWTPYQPSVEDTVPSQSAPVDLATTDEHAAPNLEEIPISTAAPESHGSVEPLELEDFAPTPAPPRVEPKPPSVPIFRAAAPAAPVPSAPLSPSSAEVPPPTPRRGQLSELEDEEIRFDEDELVRQQGARPASRGAELGDAPEIGVEDLVSIESLPQTPLPQTPPLAAVAAPSAPLAGIPPTKPKIKSLPPTPPAPGSSPAKLAFSPPAPPTPPTPLAPPAPPAAPLPPVVATPSPPLPPVAPIATAQAPIAPPKPLSRVIVPTPGIAPPAMTEAAAQRKRTRPWWEELFNDDYIRAMSKITDAQIAAEVTFLEDSLGVEREGGVILDLACGTGLHAIELTRRGYQVVGFDLSLAMLARAADEAQERNQRLNFVQGDMREMTFEGVFDGVFSWNTSFGYFEEDKNVQVVQRVHKSLKPGGVFVLDVANRDYIIRQSPSLAWFEGEGCVCMDEMSIDWITSRMKTKRTMMFEDGRTKEIEYSIRLYSLHELGKLLHDCGFRVAEVSGRTATPGVFFGHESPRTLILAEKR